MLILNLFFLTFLFFPTPKVRAWLADETDTTEHYGHIQDWDTSKVTDMQGLFCTHRNIPSACGSNNEKTNIHLFNGDISK